MAHNLPPFYDVSALMVTFPTGSLQGKDEEAVDKVVEHMERLCAAAASVPRDETSAVLGARLLEWGLDTGVGMVMPCTMNLVHKLINNRATVETIVGCHEGWIVADAISISEAESGYTAINHDLIAEAQSKRTDESGVVNLPPDPGIPPRSPQ